MSLYSISPSTTLFPPPPSVRLRLATARRHVSLAQITVASSISAAPTSRRRACQLFDLHDRLVPFKDAWDWQRRIVKEKKVLVESKRDCPDTLIVLQHRPVYTMGTGSSEEFLNFNPKDAPFDVFRTERGHLPRSGSAGHVSYRQSPESQDGSALVPQVSRGSCYSYPFLSFLPGGLSPLRFNGCLDWYAELPLALTK